MISGDGVEENGGNRAIAPAIWQDVQARLDAVEQSTGARLLLAVESGSRAWGFPSPDSDYDVRFVYVRDRDFYLRLEPAREVIEYPITSDIDLNGWDIRKALGLLLKSNAVVSEWMESPIHYRPPHPVIASLRALADDALDPRALAHHYARLGQNAADRWLEGSDPVPVKRYFYALRPALVIRHLRLHPAERPPMDLDALVAATELPRAIAANITELVEAKRITNERSNGARAPDLDHLIRSELGRAMELPKAEQDREALRRRGDEIFLELVNA